jgi:tryptophan 7-halogenase
MLENSVSPVRRIVILGGGSAGWMAAAALSKVLMGRVAIHLVESEEIGTIGVGEATIPQIRHFNAALELNETEFVRKTQATFKLGIEFVNWGRKGESYIHSFGQVGQDLGMVAFHHYWLKMQRQGRAHGLCDYAVNTLAARAGRFAPEVHAEGSQSVPVFFAYHFDAGLYAAHLRQISEASGVRRHEGKVAEVIQRVSDGHVESLLLDSGEHIEGDLFIDCSGFRGVLIEQTLRTGYDDWSHWLPMDRAVAVPSLSNCPPTPYTRSTAHAAGWQWRIPLQHRMGNGHVYCSQFISDDEATAVLVNNLDGERLAEPRLLRFRTGKRRKLWNKNVVAMGLASGFLEPLESTSLYLVQSSISRLIQFFPHSGISIPDIEAHNRLADEEFERIRDFIILHYKATQRDDSPLWRQCRDMPVPEQLQQKLDLYRSTGRILRSHLDIFTEVSWLQVMEGQGLRPKAYHPLADLLNEDEAAHFLGTLRARVQQQVAGMPLHEDFIRTHCAAEPVR